MMKVVEAREEKTFRGMGWVMEDLDLQVLKALFAATNRT
jgi:hypothetical protein